MVKWLDVAESRRRRIAHVVSSLYLDNEILFPRNRSLAPSQPNTDDLVQTVHHINGLFCHILPICSTQSRTHKYPLTPREERAEVMRHAQPSNLGASNLVFRIWPGLVLSKDARGKFGTPRSVASAG